MVPITYSKTVFVSLKPRLARKEGREDNVTIRCISRELKRRKSVVFLYIRITATSVESIDRSLHPIYNYTYIERYNNEPISLIVSYFLQTSLPTGLQRTNPLPRTEYLPTRYSIGEYKTTL